MVLRPCLYTTKMIEKATSTVVRLTTRVWANPDLSVKTRDMGVYNDCETSTLLYDSEIHYAIIYIEYSTAPRTT